MTISESLSLLAIDESGRPGVPPERLDPALGAAHAVDLALLERITVDDDGVTVRIIDHRPPPEPALATALHRLAEAAPQTAADAVATLADGARVSSYAGLEGAGVLRRTEDESRWQTVTRGLDARIRASVRDVLLTGAVPAGRTAGLALILTAYDLLALVVGREEESRARAAARVLIDRFWNEPETLAALAAADTLLTAARCPLT